MSKTAKKYTSRNKKIKPAEPLVNKYQTDTAKTFDKFKKKKK